MKKIYILFLVVCVLSLSICTFAADKTGREAKVELSPNSLFSSSNIFKEFSLQHLDRILNCRSPPHVRLSQLFLDGSYF